MRGFCNSGNCHTLDTGVLKSFIYETYLLFVPQFYGYDFKFTRISVANIRNSFRQTILLVIQTEFPNFTLCRFLFATFTHSMIIFFLLPLPAATEALRLLRYRHFWSTSIELQTKFHSLGPVFRFPAATILSPEIFSSVPATRPTRAKLKTLSLAK